MNGVDRVRLMPPAGFLLAIGAVGFLLALGGVAPAEIRIVPVSIGAAFLFMLAVRWPLEMIVTVYPFLWPIGFFPIPVPFSEGYTVSPERILGAVVLPPFLVALATGRLKCRPMPGSLKMGIGVLSLTHLTSSLYHGAGIEETLQIVQKAGLTYLAFAAVADEATARRLVRMSILGCAAAALAVVILAIMGQDLDALILTRTGGVPGLDLGNPLHYAMVQAARNAHAGQFGVWLALVEAGFAKTGRGRAAWTILALGLLVTQMLVFRRMVFVAGVLGLLFLALYRRTRVRGVAGAVLVSAGLLFGTLIVPNSPLWEYRIVEETLPQLREGSDPREELLYASLEAWSDAPVFGYGPGQYGGAVGRHESLLERWDPSGPIAAHNSFALLAVEMGSVGLIGVLFFLGALVRELRLADRAGAPGYTGHLMAMWPVLFGQVMLWWVLGSALYLTLSWFLFGMLAGTASLARSLATPGGARK